MMRRREEGSALAVVLVALMVLLPLTLILSGMVVRWQKQAAEFRDLLAMEYAARAGLEEVANRIRAGSIDIQPDKTTDLELTDLGDYGARVRVSRTQDTVLAMSGEFLDEAEATEVDLSQTATDPDMRKVRLYRRLEVFLVEVRVSVRPGLAGIKLWGTLIRSDDGKLRQAGIQVRRELAGASSGIRLDAPALIN
jgi:hypothetical protein